MGGDSRTVSNVSAAFRKPAFLKAGGMDNAESMPGRMVQGQLPRLECTDGTTYQFLGNIVVR